MGVVTGGGGGAAFNGGTTLTGAPTVLSPANKDTTALQIRPVTGATADATDELEVYDDAGNLIGFWDASGNLRVVGSLTVILSSGGSNAFLLSDSATTCLDMQDGHQGVRIWHPAPATHSFVSGTGAQLNTSVDVLSFTPVTFNPTAGAAATCAVAVSRIGDGVSYTTLWTETVPAGVALDGTVHGITVPLPGGWYLRLTVVNATIGTTTYF